MQEAPLFIHAFSMKRRRVYPSIYLGANTQKELEAQVLIGEYIAYCDSQGFVAIRVVGGENMMISL